MIKNKNVLIKNNRIMILLFKQINLILSITIKQKIKKKINKLFKSKPRSYG